MAPPAKKQKTEEEAAAKDEEMKGEEEETKEETKAPEPAKELEEDAPADKKPKVQEPLAFNVADTTMNVMVSTANNVLMCMQEGGMQHLLAGARANTGIKSGRYMFEVKTVEMLNPMSDGAARGPKPKNLVKVGFAVAGASLLLGSEGTVGFDSEGLFFDAGKKTRVGHKGKFGRDSIVSVLLNLDASSPNANTVSLFVGGKRASEPQALPESLKGKALFPAVTFRNATLHANFGPSPLCPLPFKCRMVQDAAKADTVAATSTAADSKTLVMPVALPEEGPFDWLDGFLAANPDYIELSDRMIVSWAEKSGLMRGARSGKGSSDKPEFGFGIREMDDGSIRRAIMCMAPLQQRNFVIMELKDNLIKESRTATLSRFGDDFKKVAHVVMGEPTAAFKKKTLEATLKAKQDASDASFNAKKAEEKRKKILEKKQKEAERARKKAEKERAKKIKEAQEALKKKQEALKKAKEGEEAKEEETKEEEKKEEEPEEEEEPIPEVEDDPTPPPKVELDDEEKKLWYKKTAVPDMSSYVLSTQFTKFTVPSKDEGFAEIKYEWAKDAKCEEYLKKWILGKKLSVKVEDLVPSQWFFQQNRQWEDCVRKWHKGQNDFKAKVAKKIADKQRKEAKEKAAAAAKAAAEAKKAKEAEEAKAKGEEPKEEEKKEEEPAPMEVEEKEEEEVVVDFDGVDIFGVEDVMDLGGGMPLFKEFNFEDWAMMALHFELHLLAHAFGKDVKDPERAGIILDHLPFYYNKYFKKQLTPKAFGVETTKELVEMASDSVKLTDKDTIESLLPDEMESMQIFVQMTEEARRYRKYKLDLGEESAKLKLSPQAHAMPSSGGGPAKGAGKGPGKISNVRFSPYGAAAPGRVWGGARKGAGKGA